MTRLKFNQQIFFCVFQSHDKGKQLLEYVCQQLNLVEKDYFGLRYVDQTRQRVWTWNWIAYLTVLGYRILRRWFGCKREEVTGGWRRFPNEDLHDFLCSPAVNRVLKSRRS